MDEEEAARPVTERDAVTQDIKGDETGEELSESEKTMNEPELLVDPFENFLNFFSPLFIDHPDESNLNYGYLIIMSIIVFILSMIIHNLHTYDIVGKIGGKIPQIKPYFKGNLLVGVHSLLLSIIFYFILKHFPDEIVIQKS